MALKRVWSEGCTFPIQTTAHAGKAANKNCTFITISCFECRQCLHIQQPVCICPDGVHLQLGTENSHTVLKLLTIQDLANPTISQHLQLYPEIVENAPISQVWQATCWKEFDRSELNPMYDAGAQHFYVDELAQLQDGSFVIPQIWFTWRQGMVVGVYAECVPVAQSPVCSFYINLHSAHLDMLDGLDYWGRQAKGGGIRLPMVIPRATTLLYAELCRHVNLAL